MTGQSPDKIVRYYIVVDGNFINVREITILLKKNNEFPSLAFHLSFDENLKPLMKFIKHFFYKIPSDFEPTTHMLRVFNDISKEN